MHDVLARSELRVQRDGGIVAMVCLDVNDIRATRGRELLKFGDERRCNAPSPVLLENREVVDVDLASGLLELGKHVRRKPADHGCAIKSCDCDKGIAGEQATKVIIVRLS